jgi:hypothetical protein
VGGISVILISLGGTPVICRNNNNNNNNNITKKKISTSQSNRATEQ